ncbi:MAG: KH domain-containing protein [Candidatus Marsarchaeota archaeon]|jgi:exosome complex component RRP4|nr:KH domain-containing protein [Candidatus Marsarchaeota archaeon]MCL5112650.1 KH domain-containing protein [Candidatus Marsarchaeota archaeon]
MREIIFPGQSVERTASREGTYMEGGKVYSKIIGLYDDSNGNIISLEGAWRPRMGEKVVGVVSEIGRKDTYKVVLSTNTEGIIISGRYERFRFKVGDVIEASIARVESESSVVLERPKPLGDGMIIEIKPTKVPRVIGKGNTMIDQIANLTKCRISVGMNGLVWLNDGDLRLAVSALRRIEREAHTSGLTEKIKKMLNGE